MSDERSYTVSGMTCGHCERAVGQEIERVPRVEQVSVDLETKLVTVRGDGVDDGAVRAAIAEAGYEVDR